MVIVSGGGVSASILAIVAGIITIPDIEYFNSKD
jgi:hypothetical protein